MLSPSQIFCPSQLVLSWPPPQGQRSHAVERESERGEPAAARRRIYAGSREAKEARRISQGQRPLRYLSSVRGRKLNCERGVIVENQAEPGEKTNETHTSVAFALPRLCFWSPGILDYDSTNMDGYLSALGGAVHATLDLYWTDGANANNDTHMCRLVGYMKSGVRRVHPLTMQFGA